MSALRAESTMTPATPYAQARAHAAKVEDMLCGEDMKRKTHSELETMLEGTGQGMGAAPARGEPPPARGGRAEDDGRRGGRREAHGGQSKRAAARDGARPR